MGGLLAEMRQLHNEVSTKEDELLGANHLMELTRGSISQRDADFGTAVVELASLRSSVERNEPLQKGWGDIHGAGPSGGTTSVAVGLQADAGGDAIAARNELTRLRDVWDQRESDLRRLQMETRQQEQEIEWLRKV